MLNMCIVEEDLPKKNETIFLTVGLIDSNESNWSNYIALMISKASMCRLFK